MTLTSLIRKTVCAKMPTRHCTEAVVLRKHLVGESNAVVTLFCPDLGKLIASVPGARNSRKRFAGCLELFSRITVWMVDKGADRMPRLEEAILLDSHEPIKTDLWAIGQAGYFAELISALVAENDPVSKLYDLLNQVLKSLDQRHFTPLEVRFYELLVLKHAGFGPNFTNCLECDAPSSDAWKFDPSQGGLLCAACAIGLDARKKYITLSSKEFAMLSGMQAGRLPESTPDVGSLRILRNLMCELIDYHVGRPLKSRQFLLQLAAEACK